MYSKDFIESLVDKVGEALGVDTGMCLESRFNDAMDAAQSALEAHTAALRDSIAKACADMNNAITPLIINAQLDTGETPPGLQRTADLIKALKEVL